MDCRGAIGGSDTGGFLYVSPLFDGFGQSADPKPDALVKPITASEPEIEFEFYEVLPEQKFQSIPEGVSIKTEKIIPCPSHQPM